MTSKPKWVPAEKTESQESSRAMAEVWGQFINSVQNGASLADIGELFGVSGDFSASMMKGIMASCQAVYGEAFMKRVVEDPEIFVKAFVGGFTLCKGYADELGKSRSC